MSVTAAQASIASQRAEVQQLQSQLSSINYQADAAVNNYDGAEWRLQTARQQIAQNTTQIATNTAALKTAQDVLAERLRELYAQPQPNALEVLLASGNITSVVDTVTLVQHISQEDGNIVAGVRGTLNDLKQERVQLLAAQKSAVVQVAAAAQQRDKVLGLLNQRRQLLASAQASLRNAIAAQAAAEAQAAREQRAAALAAYNNAQAAAQGSSGQASSSGGGNLPVALPSGAGNGAAVVEAERFLGVPYVWGGESPSGFDCSGLVAYAYEHSIGLSMPHYTVAQYDMFPKVPLSDLEPGDIVFFYGLDHEGMYIGGGDIIQAPYTGTVVQITPLADMPTPDGAVRP